MSDKALDQAGKGENIEPSRGDSNTVDALPTLRARGLAVVRVFGFLVVAAAAVVASGSFLLLTGATGFEPNPSTWTLIWIANGVLILLLIALVLTEVITLLQSRFRKRPGARLQTSMVAMFAFVGAAPAVIVAIVASIVLNQGLDQWFSERTRSMMESSRLVTRAYMLEHAAVLRDDIIWVATELEAARETFETDRDRYLRILTSLAVTRSVPFTTLIDGDGDPLMRAEISTQGPTPTLPDNILPDVGEGAPTLIAPGQTNMIGAVVKLRGYDDTYVFVARPVNQEVLEYMRLTDQNISEYQDYATNRFVFQITFTIMYAGLALVLLLAAVWIGIALANRFIDPIRNLMVASNRVSKGDLDVQVPVNEPSGDLHDLNLRFNRMTQQLKSQRQALINANETNEKRRQFTEAVVEGVSAGIVGLDPFGMITLANARACEMLGRSEIDLVGEEAADAIPELSEILNRAISTRRPQNQHQIELGQRTYQVRLTREGTMTESKGFVLTLDDITDLVTAQRTSAWADVARRIAHEIKNPLTPIQLSAERLRRRYAERLSDDFDVFDKCVSTIVRHVSDIGRMVDEFSDFARMPSAVLEHGDIAETARQAVFLESVRQPEIEIRADVPEHEIPARFDERLISQALTNLIKNAVEALEGTGLDTIDHPLIVISTEEEGDRVRIKVSDNGPGWPEHDRQRLLEPYMTTNDKGTGLGLAIVAKVVEQHGGTVDLIDSDPDANGRVGACFSFTLPAAGPAMSPDLDDASGDKEEDQNEGEPRVEAVTEK